MRAILVTLMLMSTTLSAQSPKSPAFAWMGGEMIRSTPSLVEIGLSSRNFLDLGDRLQLTEEQTRKLEEINLESISKVLEQSSELQLAAARVDLLLSRPKINLGALEGAFSEQARLRSAIQMIRIRSALEAIDVLGHDQHNKALLAHNRKREP